MIAFAFILSLVIIYTFSENNVAETLINILSSLTNSGLTLTNQVETTLLYIILCIIGGALISNSSGIKFLRIYILLKTASSEIIKLVRPNNVFNNSILYSENKIDNQVVSLSF